MSIEVIKYFDINDNEVPECLNKEYGYKMVVVVMDGSKLLDHKIYLKDKKTPPLPCVDTNEKDMG